MSTTEQAIDQFCSYFSREIDEISRLAVSHTDSNSEPSSGSGPLYRKVLYVTMLDTLAGVRFSQQLYPKLARQNQSRFARFVIEHCSWPEAELVSLPFLLEELRDQDLVTSTLGQHISGSVAKYSTEDGGILPAARIDEPLAALLSYAVNEIESLSIRKYQHIALLYRYRNRLVHESRQPGYAMEVAESPEPYYHGYLGDNSWHLGYPLAMFEKILRNAVTSFRSYMVGNAIDPYTQLDDAKRW